MALKKKSSPKYNIKKVKEASKAKSVKEVTVTVYKSGNSKVVTIPSGFPYREGDSFVIKKNKKGLVLEEKIDLTKQQQRILKQIGKFAGTHDVHALRKMNIDELEKYLEGIYD